MKIEKILVALCFISIIFFAEAAELTQKLSASEIHLGDEITWTITVDGPMNDSDLAMLKSKEWKPFILKDVKISANQNASNRSALILTLTSFELGDHLLPDFILHQGDPSGSNEITVHNTQKITVKSVLTDQDKDYAQIRDIKPSNFGKFLLGIAVLGLILSLWLIFLYLKRRNRKNVTTPVSFEPQRPAITVAIDQLHQLERNKNMSTRELYFELSKIIRMFMENLTSRPFLEFTLLECKATLEQLQLSGNEYDKLLSWLSLWQPTQFAHNLPGSIADESHSTSPSKWIQDCKALLQQVWDQHQKDLHDSARRHL